MTDMRLARLTVDNGSVAEDLRKIQGLFDAVGGSVENTTKRLTGTSREFQAVARQAGVVTDAGAKIVRVFGEAKAAIDKGSVSAEDGARAMATLAKTVGITGQGLVEFVNTARASRATLEGLTEGTKEYREATAAHNRTLAEAIQKQQEKRRVDEEAARKAQEATETFLRNARAVQALAEQMDSSTAAQNRFAAKQQEVIDLFVAGDLNGRQFAKAMEHVSNSFDPAVIEARKLQVEYQNLLAKYDPIRAAVREHGQEVARATTILDKSNASEQVRATVLKGIADAYDPATKAANERTAALKREEEAQAALMASYREQAAHARSSAEGQATWNAYAGVTAAPITSAKASADVFGPMLERQVLADEWESLIAMEGFAQKERIAQTKVAVASNWEAQLAMDAWGAAEAKARLAAEWEGMLAVEEIKTAERVALTKAAVAERWEAQIAMEGFAAAEAKAKLAKEWEDMLAAEEFAQKERIAQLKHHAAQVMQAELDLASFDAPAKFNRLVAGYDKESTDALKYANALGELQSTAAAAGIPLEQLAAAEEKLAAKMSPAALAAKRQADELAELRRAIDPMGERLRDLEAKKLKLDEAFAAGKLEGGRTEYEALSAAYEKHRLQLVRSTEAAEGFAGKIGLTRAQMTALAPQINDVVSGLMMGQPPMMIFVQQSGQIVQALQAGGAEFKLFSGSMGVALGAVAGLTVAMVALVAASESYRNSINAVNDANRIMGDATGYSRGQLEDLAGSLDKVSTRSARQMETAFIRVGNVAGDQFKGAMEIARDFARVTGQEVPEAAQKLADLLKDPAKGAETLRDGYRALTAAQAEYVQRLAAQGDVGKAQQVQLDALKAKYQDFADEGVGYLARAYHFLRTGVSDAWDWMGRIGAPKSLTSQLADAEAVVAKIEAKFRSTMGRAPVGNELRQMEPEAYGEVDALRARKAAEEAVAAARAAGAAAEERRKAGLSLSKQMDTEIGQQNALNDQYRALEKSADSYAQQIDALSQGEGRAAAQLGQVKEAYSQVAEALDRVKNAKATHLSVSERLARQDQIALSYATQYGQTADRNRAREQAELETAGQKLTTKEREAKINSAVNQVIAQQTAAVTGQVVAARSATVSLDLLTTAYGRNAASVRDAELAQKVIQATMGMAPDLARQVARAITEQELAQRRLNAATYAANLRDQVEDAQRLAGAWQSGAAAVREAALANEVLAEARKRGLDAERDAATIRGIAEGVAARDIAQRAQTFGQMAEEQRQAVALANAEYALLGQSNSARAQQIAMLQVANDLRSKGADLADAGTRAYIKQAGELARVNSILQDAAQNAANIAQPISTAFEDVLVGAKKAGDAFKALGEDLKRIVVRQAITKPFETLVSGELTKLMAGPVAVTNDNTPKAANDNGLIDRIIGKVNGGLGSSPSTAMWVQMAAGAAALDASSMAVQTMAGPVPVAIADGGAIVDTIRAEARAQGVPEEVALAVAKIESGFRQHEASGRVLTSSAGAQGVMQLMPGTADWLGVDAANTRENIRGGVKFLSMLGRQFGGDWTMAAAAYNAGPARAQAWQRGDATLPAETVAYIQKFTGAMQEAGTRATGVTRAMEDEMAARLDAVPVQRSSTAAQAEWTAAQRATIDAALGLTAANDNTAASIEVVARPMDKLRENAISAAEAQEQAAKLNVQSARDMAQASQQSAAMMVGGTQQAVGGILSIVGALSGIKGGGIPGQVVAAGGPQGIMASVQQFGSALGEWAKKPLESLGLSGAGSIMDAKLFNLGSAPTAANGMIRGSESAMTAQGAGGAPGFTVGNALSTVGYGVNAFMNFKQGNVVGGIGNTAAAAMMFIPGAQAFAPLVAIGSSLLGGLFGGQKPSNREGNVSIDFGTGATTVGGQEGKKYSAENRQAAQGIGGQIQQLAATLEALLPGQQIKGRGLIAVGDRDGLRAEYAGQTQNFGKEDTAGLAAWFAKQFAADMKSGFERGDLPAQVADNLQVVLDRGVTNGVEQFVADLQFASTDFAKAFDTVGAAQPAQVAGAVTEVTQSFLAMRDRAVELGLAIDGLAESQKRATDRLIDAEIRSARGQNDVSSAMAIRETFTKVATQLLAAGQDGQKAVELYGAQMESLLVSMGDTAASLEAIIQLANAVRSTDPVAALWADTRAGQVRDKLLGDLDLRQQQASVQMLAGDPAQQQAAQDAYDMRALLLEQDRELRSVTDAVYRAKLLEVQATERQALTAQQAAKAQAELTAKQQALISAGGSVRNWLDQQRATAGTSVSPQDARDAAQAQFARDLALARGGDVDAYGRLTGAADRLLSSQEALTASGTETQMMRAWVMSSLENLPAVKSYDQQMLEELRKLGGSVNVQVELTTVRVITEQLSALSDADKAKLTQAAVVLRTVEERIGRFLTDAELGRLVDNALVTRDVQQTLGRDLTDAERTALVGGGNVLRTVEQLMGRTLTAVEVESIVQSGSVSRSIEQAIGRNLTAAEAAAIIEAGSVTRSIGQFLARDLSAPEVAALVVGGAVERMVTQQLGRDLTDAERAGLVTAATVIRSVEQQLGRPLNAAEQAAIILPGSVQRTIGQQIDPATGAVLVPGGTITRTVTQSVETTETVQISRSMDDKMSGILASIKESSAGINTSAAGMQKLLERAVDGDGLMVRTRPTGDPRQWVAFEQGGVVPGYENGGIVANGIPGRDSVVARGPGGMPIWLAGLEGILTAPATAAIGGKSTIDYINQYHALPGWERVGYEAGGIAPPANDIWAPNVTPIRRQDYAPASSRSGSDDRAVAELRLLRQAIERLERRLERNEGMDQEQRAAIAQEMARLLDRVADAAETTAQKVSGRQG
ncbi:phage tail length tape measure family protein [Azospirillum brasilense]|uniref:phage tail length tape measure family protein n=1 Tax=Azospirillum brasilense TaxID=192 RepID=UPI001EDA4A45|nr:phage tail length tape measure family protein [Azospirillum brasilense]UKJ74474.1 phage tail length tape measure family protein [Azospirillum brasilense]